MCDSNNCGGHLGPNFKLDSSSEQTNNGNVNHSNKKAICRDFLRGACSRGDACRYRHPKTLVFCHDFQHGCCNRNDCAFIHCSREEMDYYKKFGRFPTHMEINYVKDAPLCKDYLKGECDRVHCKFRHSMSPPAEYPNYQGAAPDFQSPTVTIPQKRRRFDDIYSPVTLPPPPHPQPPPAWTLEDENSFLRKAVADLKKRVDDLQATNEFLLEQNAQMRLNEKRPGLTAVTVPAAVTITNGQIQPQVSGTIRTVTASVATVPVSIAAVAAGTPVSIATVSMSPVMPAPSVTMATPHQASSVDNAPPLLSTAAGQLVSYPIVARPVITSLTH